MVSGGAYFRPHALYRSRHGLIFGVCRGLADYAEISPFWLRTAFVVLCVTTGFLPVAMAYLVFAILMKPAPVVLPRTDDDWAFYHVYAASRRTAVSQLQRRMADLDRRARRIEDIVTSRGFDWDRRLGEYAPGQTTS